MKKAKKHIKDLLKRFLYVCNYKWLMQDNILMESNPDLCDNTYAVYEELLKRGLNNKFRIIWLVKNDEYRDMKIKNVKFINVNKSFFSKLQYKYYNILSKYIINCNANIRKLNKNQFKYYMTHAGLLKDAYEVCYVAQKDSDYINQQSDIFIDTIVKSDNIIKREQVTVLGYPRNDYLFRENIDANKYIKTFHANKTIVWLPTYRNHKSLKIENSFWRTGVNFEFGIPCIENEKQINELNFLLKKEKISLIIKLHPAEDVSKISKLDLSNIKLITNEQLKENRINIYQLLKYSDAMITDYSSIYYDYLLTKKPIGLAIPDLENYINHVGIVWKDYKESIKGEYIYTFEELKIFIDNISRGIDNLYDERIEMMKRYNKYQDDKSSKRVVDFFLKIINNPTKNEGENR